MARTEDGPGDEPPPKRPNTALWIVLGTVATVAVVCVGGPVAFTLMWADMARRDEQARQEIAAVADAEYEQSKRREEAAKKARVYDRAEFRALVAGKTEQEVLNAIGEPDRKEDKGADALTYFYDAKTTDPATGKPDPTTAVRFKFGRVNSVTP